MTLTATPQKPKSVTPTKSAKAIAQQELVAFVKEQVLLKLGTPKNLSTLPQGICGTTDGE